MPRFSSRRRQRPESVDVDDSDVQTRDGGIDLRVSHGTKRRRISSNAAATTGSVTDHESDVEIPSTIPRRGNGSSDYDLMQDFQPGAIVRVTVENFVTYEKAEFFPGPHLNMVIGPNGTGKSSLVCAICLGLGYGPKHLGRAGSVKEFVKHGRDIATIEIELFKKPTDRSNYVVKVQIRREQNSQKWWLNGKETNHKRIQDLMRSLKIQVDNLCQFLPQDRVVEFAACTPVDLLHETLRAAAPEQMLEWQRQLQELHKEKRELADAASANSDTLQNLETRQQGIQADVDRIRERQEVQEKVKDLRSALVLAKYREAREKYRAAKERKKEAEQTLKRLESESGPSLQAVNHKQYYAQQIQSSIPSMEDDVKSAENEAQKLSSEIGNATDGIKELNNKMDAEQNGYKEKRKEISAAKARITNFQADLKSRPSDFNAADWNIKIRAEEHTKRELEADRRRMLTEMDDIKQKANRNAAEERQLNKEMQDLNTQQGRQESFMRRVFPEVAAAWEWIQNNRGEFEKEVLGPPMISCSIKDERYSDQVQALLQKDDFLCFTAQTKNDYKKLTHQLYRELSLSVVVRTCPMQLSSFQSPINGKEAALLGLDGFALDFLTGPDAVLAMLCAEKRIHQSGVALSEHTDEAYNRLIQNGRISQWAAGRQSFTVRRRKEYGPQAMTTIAKNIPRGNFWASQPVGDKEREELDRKIKEAVERRRSFKEQHDVLDKKTDAIEEQKSEIEKKIEQLRREKSALQQEYQKWQSLPEKIESEERKQAAHEQALRDARKRMVQLEFEHDEAVLQRARLITQHKEQTDKIRVAHLNLVEAAICLIEANSDVEGLKQRNANVMKELEEQKQRVREAAADSTQCKSVGEDLGRKARDTMEPESTERQDYLAQLATNSSVEDVQMEISAEEAKLELIHAANPNAMRDFERRAEEIKQLQRKMEGTREKLQGIETRVNELMGKWELKLDELVAEINDAFAYNFEQISCAGEVRVHKDDDFSQWALDIMVKFRENETMQQLTAHRQSGGERAVSTIFYLMALQSLAQSPFRVVDEINQGMDPRNERMVHERMVEIACREHTSQYFLITPKLLTGLRYDAKMRVLCIASGEHMPEEGRKLDFAKCIQIQKSMMAAR